MYFYVRFISVQ